MKTIYLLRHAKSDWSEEGQRDFDRKLNARGKKDAPILASFIQKTIPIEDSLIVSSPAVRTKETLKPLMQYIPKSKEIIWRDDLYESGAKAYMNVIRTLPEPVNSALIVGHNPSIHDVVEYLIAGSETFGLLEVPTGALISIQIPVLEWKWIEGGSGILRWMIHPKLLHAVM